MKPGLSAGVDLVVSEADTAIALHTGTVPVLATPRVVALCEEASIAAIHPQLREGETTVGAKVKIDHLEPTGVGRTVRAQAVIEKVVGRRITCTVSVSDDRGLVAVARVTRVLVDRERFLDKTR